MNGPQGPSPATRRRRPILLLVLVTLGVVLLGGTSYWAVACPCDRTPGLYLRGTEATAPVTDWSFANQIPLCQIQVDAGLLPHALNLNCWSTSTGELYLSCARCEGKRWSTPPSRTTRHDCDSTTRCTRSTLTRVVDRRNSTGPGSRERQDREPE